MHAETRSDVRRAHRRRCSRLLGDSEAEAADAARRVMALETRLAAGHWDNVASRDVVKTYNLMTRAELEAAAPDFDWAAWEAGHAGAEHRVERGRRPAAELPHDAERGARRGAARRLEAVAAVPNVVSAAAPYLSDDFVAENFDFYRRTLTGAQEMKLRWKRAVALADALLGEAVGEVYVARHFPPASKAKMDELVANLVEAYRQSIEQARLDEPGDPRAGAGQAGSLPAEDRLPRRVARLLRARDPARRPDRKRTPRRLPSSTTGSSPSSAGRSIAASGT